MHFELDGNVAFNEFICELIVDDLEALVMAVTPELAPEEFLAIEDLQMLRLEPANL
jgi:hypothetical protein